MAYTTTRGTAGGAIGHSGHLHYITFHNVFSCDRLRYPTITILCSFLYRQHPIQTPTTLDFDSSSNMSTLLFCECAAVSWPLHLHLLYQPCVLHACTPSAHIFCNGTGCANHIQIAGTLPKTSALTMHCPVRPHRGPIPLTHPL